jgi:hypothetical protein
MEVQEEDEHEGKVDEHKGNVHSRVAVTTRSLSGSQVVTFVPEATDWKVVCIHAERIYRCVAMNDLSISRLLD